MIGGMGDEPGNLGNLPMGQPPMAIVSSPPYASARPESNGGGVDLTKQWETYRASGGGQSLEAFTATQLKHSQGYGSASGQLASMVVGSPPFADSVGSDDPDKRGGLFRDEKRRNDTNLTGTYGETPGQLGGMKAGAVISSPPYATGEKGHPSLGSVNKDDWGNEGTDIAGRRGVNGDYGSTDGQLATGSPDTFWAAAKTIVEQCALLLPPNGVAIWVVKNYIKSGIEVDFTGQWQALCEACGFETVHVHRAMLVKENGAQGNMFGADKKNKVERKSFFRRLAEAAKKADAHWGTLSNEDRVALIAAAYARLFEDYLAKLKTKTKPAAITKTRLMREAKSKAWLRDGKPHYEIATSIDFETILCMRKPASSRGTGKAL